MLVPPYIGSLCIRSLNMSNLGGAINFSGHAFIIFKGFSLSIWSTRWVEIRNKPFPRQPYSSCDLPTNLYNPPEDGHPRLHCPKHLWSYAHEGLAYLPPGFHKHERVQAPTPSTFHNPTWWQRGTPTLWFTECTEKSGRIPRPGLEENWEGSNWPSAGCCRLDQPPNGLEFLWYILQIFPGILDSPWLELSVI